jgi:F-type H+-transporting ATPase subunit delta
MAKPSKQTSRPSPLATSYAQSLLELANEKTEAEPLGQQLADVRKIVEENPSAGEMFANPSVSIEERARLLDKVFRNNVSPLIFNLLGVMNQHGRLGLISQVAESYDDLLDEQLGKIEVDLIVAQKLSPDQLETAKKKITQALGKDAVLHQYVDDQIIGGMVIRVGDKLIDASVRNQLEMMKQQLLAAAPK